MRKNRFTYFGHVLLLWNAGTGGRNLSVMESIEDLKNKINLPFGMDIIIVAGWSIWIVRKNMIFLLPFSWPVLLPVITKDHPVQAGRPFISKSLD
jgi:hypothetical protein